MLVMSEERYVPVTPGYITLQDSDGVYYYVHRTFYEQAVVMQDRYGEKIETLQQLIGGHPEYVAIEKYVKYVPKPLTIMGYFLALMEEDIEDFTDIVGAMDTIAEVLNLRELIKQPVAIRQQVSFNMSVENLYRDRWDLFLQQCYEYDWMKSQLGGGPAYSGGGRATSYASSSSEPEDSDDENLSDEDLWAKAMEEFNEGTVSGLEELDKKKEEEAAPATDGGSGLAVAAAARKRRRGGL